MALILYQLFDLVIDIAVEAVAAVVGGYIQAGGHLFHFLFQNNKAFVSCADNAVGFYALFMKPFHLGINRGGSHASGYKQQLHLPQFFHRFMNQL